tara:strand:- start:187 stop:906 length:720 start_codon:yes stop_codon:yes gene_type:complete
MKALILVGGKGTRLKPYTTVIPKPLLPVGDKPILELIIEQLRLADIDEVILAVGHMSHLFESFFKKGERHGLKISYSFEEKALGTAGAIANSIERLGDDFLVMNGDLLTTLNYKKLISFHKKNKSAGTIATFNRKVQMDFGVIEFDKKGRLISLEEKPTYSYNFGMGVNVLNSNKASKYLSKDKFLDMPDLMTNMEKEGEDVFCYQEDCFWLDMGRPEDYERANEEYESRKQDFLNIEY